MSENTIGNVTLYSKSNCVKCAQTKRFFEKYGIAYQEVNLETHPELVEQFKAQGFMEAPVIVAPHKSWSGFRMDEIKTLARMRWSELLNLSDQEEKSGNVSIAHMAQEVKDASKELRNGGNGNPPPVHGMYRD